MVNCPPTLFNLCEIVRNFTFSQRKMMKKEMTMVTMKKILRYSSLLFSYYFEKHNHGFSQSQT